VLHRALRGRPVGSAIDIGSGTGWVVRRLLAHGADSVTGVELTGVAIDRLRRDLPAVTFQQLDVGIEALPAAAAAIDVVTMLDVAYHLVQDAGLDHVVSEITRVLRPGGIALVTDSFAAFAHEPAEHVRFRSLPQWSELLEGHGLSVQQTLPYFKTLSRPRADTWRHWIHPRVRGPLEWAIDTTLPLRPWLRLAVIGSTRK